MSYDDYSLEEKSLCLTLNCFTKETNCLYISSSEVMKTNILTRSCYWYFEYYETRYTKYEIRNTKYENRSATIRRLRTEIVNWMYLTRVWKNIPWFYLGLYSYDITKYERHLLRMYDIRYPIPDYESLINLWKNNHFVSLNCITKETDWFLYF